MTVDQLLSVGSFSSSYCERQGRSAFSHSFQQCMSRQGSMDLYVIGYVWKVSDSSGLVIGGGIN